MKEYNKKLLSIIIPIYNEQGAIQGLHSEILEVCMSLTNTFEREIIYINDGSTDESLLQLKQLKYAQIITLAKKYGQGSALDAGFKASRGDIIISLDGDGQNDPADIPLLIKKLQDENLDVVAGWRKDRKDCLSIRITSYLGRLIKRNIFSEKIHDSGCTLRAYTKEAISSLNLKAQMHRHIIFILYKNGFRVGEVETTHRLRLYGKSKYTSLKIFRSGIDMVRIWYQHTLSSNKILVNIPTYHIDSIDEV